MADTSWVTAVIGGAGVAVGSIVTWRLGELSDVRKRKDDAAIREQDRQYEERVREREQWHDYRRDLYARLIDTASNARNAARSHDNEVRTRTCQDVAALVAQVGLYAGTTATAEAAAELGEVVAEAVGGGQTAWFQPLAATMAFIQAVRRELGLEELR